MENFPYPFINYNNFSEFNSDENIELNDIYDSQIENIITSTRCKRSKAIKYFIKNQYNLNSTILEICSKKYNLKFSPPEKGIYTIIGLPSMEESGIFSINGKYVLLSNLAAEVYGVKKLEEMVNKPIFVFRRFKKENGDYETPYVYYLQKATILELYNLDRLDTSDAKIEYDGSEEMVSLQRICIDWNYKK
jgi:hypothetical protein